MKTITKTIKLFTLDELSEEAQQKAHQEWLKGDPDESDREDYVATLKAFEKHFPVNIRDYSLGSYRSSVDLEVTCDDDVAGLTGKRLMSYLWNNYGDVLFPRKYLQHIDVPAHRTLNHPMLRGGRIKGGETTPVSNHTMRGYFCYSRIQRTNDGAPLTGVYSDADMLKPLYEAMEGKRYTDTFEDLLKECGEECASGCEKSCEARQEFDYFKEECESNEWTFTEDGEMYND